MPRFAVAVGHMCLTQPLCSASIIETIPPQPGPFDYCELNIRGSGLVTVDSGRSKRHDPVTGEQATVRSQESHRPCSRSRINSATLISQHRSLCSTFWRCFGMWNGDFCLSRHTGGSTINASLTRFIVEQEDLFAWRRLGSFRSPDRTADGE